MASLFIVGIERTEFRNEIQKEIEEETHGMFMAALRFWELIEDCLKSFAEEPSAIVVDFGKEDIPIGRFMPASVLAGPARPDEIRDIGASVLDDIQSRTLDRFLRFDCDQKLERMHEDITLHLDLLHYAEAAIHGGFLAAGAVEKRIHVLYQREGFYPAGKATELHGIEKHDLTARGTGEPRRSRRTRWKRRRFTRSAPCQLNSGQSNGIQTVGASVPGYVPYMARGKLRFRLAA